MRRAGRGPAEGGGRPRWIPGRARDDKAAGVVPAEAETQGMGEAAQCAACRDASANTQSWIPGRARDDKVRGTAQNFV